MYAQFVCEVVGDEPEGQRSVEYWMWLAGVSLAFVVLERLWPRREEQRFLRAEFSHDLAYLVFNGHLLGVVVALISPTLEELFQRGSKYVGVEVDVAFARDWPLVVQFLVAFVVLDLIQWCIHNLLHRIPLLWSFHKVHHSITVLDWIGSMRFHWFEIVVYKTLQYVPLALFGFDARVLFAHAIVGTVMGHFNHSNLRFNIGIMKYVVNSPEMHEWHHAHPSSGPANKNFGINLSLWDWVFGTAYLPTEQRGPGRLGFDDMERFPKTFLAQELWPLTQLAARRSRSTVQKR